MPKHKAAAFRQPILTPMPLCPCTSYLTKMTLSNLKKEHTKQVHKTMQELLAKFVKNFDLSLQQNRDKTPDYALPGIDKASDLKKSECLSTCKDLYTQLYRTTGRTSLEIPEHPFLKKLPYK